MKGIFSPLLLLPPLPADLVWRQWKCFQGDYMEDSIEDSSHKLAFFLLTSVKSPVSAQLKAENVHNVLFCFEKKSKILA